MFTALYKPGSEVIDGYKATCLIVPDKDLDAHLADGWVKTLAETVAPVEPVQDATLIDEATKPPTREEMELKATELKIKFDGRTSDKKLSALIEDALK